MPTPLASPAPLLGPRAGRLLVLLAVVATLAAALSPRDLWPPDEPRYGQVAREMVEGGHWLVPHLGDEPYPEKPPAFFWLAALLSLPLGDVTPWTARLAGALLAVGAILLTARLARRLFPRDGVGATAAVLFASAGLALWNAPRAGLDLPLTFFVLAAVERGLAWRHGAGPGAFALAGLAWAGAVLVKGPVGFFLPPLVLGVGALLGGAAPAGRRARGWWLMPLLLVVAGLAWLLPALGAGGEAYGDRLLGQIADRASGAEVGHRRPWFYFAERIGMLVLPWSLHMLAGVLLLLPGRARREGDRFGTAICGAGSLLFLVVLSTFATKREVYALPAFPFGAILAAVAIHRARFPRLRRLGRCLVLGVLVVLGLGALAAPWLVRARVAGLEAFAGPSLGVLTAAGVVGGCLLGGAWLAWRVRDGAVRFVRRAAVAMLVGSAAFQVAFLPHLDPVKSMRRVARAAATIAPEGPIVASGWDQVGNLLWALDGAVDHVPQVDDVADVAALLGPAAPRAAVVTTHGDHERLLEAARAAGGEVARVLERARVVWDAASDHRGLVVLTNAPREDAREPRPAPSR